MPQVPQGRAVLLLLPPWLLRLLLAIRRRLRRRLNRRAIPSMRRTRPLKKRRSRMRSERIGPGSSCVKLSLLPRRQRQPHWWRSDAPRRRPGMLVLRAPQWRSSIRSMTQRMLPSPSSRSQRTVSRMSSAISNPRSARRRTRKRSLRILLTLVMRLSARSTRPSAS